MVSPESDETKHSMEKDYTSKMDGKKMVCMPTSQPASQWNKWEREIFLCGILKCRLQFRWELVCETRSAVEVSFSLLPFHSDSLLFEQPVE